MSLETDLLRKEVDDLKARVVDLELKRTRKISAYMEIDDREEVVIMAEFAGEQARVTIPCHQLERMAIILLESRGQDTTRIGATIITSDQFLPLADYLIKAIMLIEEYKKEQAEEGK